MAPFRKLTVLPPPFESFKVHSRVMSALAFSVIFAVRIFENVNVKCEHKSLVAIEPILDV